MTAHTRHTPPTVSAAVAQIEASSFEFPTLRERAQAAHDETLSRLAAEGEAALREAMTAIVAEANRRLAIIVEPYVHTYDEGDQGVLARYVDRDGAEYTFGLRESHRPEATGAGDTLYVLIPCANCGKPVWMGAWSDDALGAALCSERIEHRNCEDEE